MFRPTLTRRLVLRTPQPSPKCSSTAMAFSSGKREFSSGVPLRSEKYLLHVRQKRQRMPRFLLLQPCHRRFPAPRFPWSGHSVF